VGLFYVTVDVGDVRLRTVYEGGYMEQQMIGFLTASDGYVYVAMKGLQSSRIYQNASAATIKSSLETVASIGYISVIVTNSPTPSPYATTWSITFLQNLGSLPLLTVKANGGSQAEVMKIIDGDTSPISGRFRLAINGEVTSELPVQSNAQMVSNALEQLRYFQTLNVGNMTFEPISVKRYNLINNGAMWLIEFPSYAGNIPLLTILTTNISATRFTTNVDVYEEGMLMKQITKSLLAVILFLRYRELTVI
jgi:hypothetical protein